jgi:tetratricopeptide (TPR) repeat protein
MSGAVPSTTFTGPLVDAEHPWLGLHPFTEENQHYFFGRTAEIRDIFLRVREQPLTVLYGQSGLGKTSLLRAGLIPKLRVERYRPVRILLDFDTAAPPLIAQVRAALADACTGEEMDAAALLARWQPLDSLWEIFAHETLRPKDLAAHPPVLILDQFEEIFTLGEDGISANADDPRRRDEAAQLITQLADVIEGRAPATLAPGFDRDPRRALAYDFGPTSVRLVLSLREDYLAQLEQWKGVLPSLMRNRMPLRLLSGPQALEAVVRPGGMGAHPLVSEDVGTYIVRFVARRDEATPLDEIEAVPPFVSLLCERLNDARLASDPQLPEITRALIEAQGADILQRFYDESFAAFPAVEREAVREYVEGRMVTIGGHRNPVAREDACAELAALGVAEPNAVLDALVGRRLLTAEQRGGIQRLEITHDVLAPLVVRARKERQDRRAVVLANRQQRERRIRRLAVAFAILGLLAVSALAFAISALRQAQKQRLRAEEALTLVQASERAAESAMERAVAAKKSADQLINYMQYDLRDTLGKLGQLKMMEGINASIQKYYEQHPVEKGDYDELRERSVSLVQQGDIFLAQGQLAEALNAYRDSLAIAEPLAKQDPNNPIWQRDLSVNFEKVGDVLSDQGELAEALKAYRDSFAIRERLAKQKPDNATWQHDLSVSLERIGDVLRSQGQLVEALKAYRDSLAIRGRLATQDPANATWQRDLSVSFDKVGNVLRDQGQLDEALKAYRDSLAIAERLAKQDPDNADWQRDLSVIFQKVGNVLRDQGQLAEALRAYRDSLAIAERLAKQDPANATWQRDLSVSFDKVGNVLRDQNQLAEALKAYRDSLAIAERLAEQEPDNADWQRDLSVSVEKVGEVLRARGQLVEALKAYRDSLVIRERLAKQEPDNAALQHDLSVSLDKVGNILRDQSQLAEALKAYRESLAIRERLAKEEPDNATWQSDLLYSSYDIAQTLEKQENFAEALPSFERATGIAEQLAKLDPTNATWQADAKKSRAAADRVRVALKRK